MINRHILPLSIILAAFWFISEPAHAYWIWTPQTKKWVNPKYAPKDTPKDQLLYAMDFYEAQDYKKALAEFRKVVTFFKRSEAASEAQYYMGRCDEYLANPYTAFEAYQKVIDDYPFSQRIDEIIERQFNIGESLYNGEKTKFLGLSFKAMPEQIIDVYKKVVSNAPYSKYAPVSQYRIGELYKKLEFYEEARAAFDKLLEDYPNSDMAAQAKFQSAMCASLASGKSGYDQKLAAQAQEEFEELARQSPDSELVKKAREEKEKLVEKQADSYMKIAKFYERLHKYQAAMIYYNKVMENFPGSSKAPLAMERLKVLENKTKKK